MPLERWNVSRIPKHGMSEKHSRPWRNVSKGNIYIPCGAGTILQNVYVQEANGTRSSRNVQCVTSKCAIKNY